MIAHLRGKLISKHPNQAIVEAAGVGYDVTISVPTFSDLPAVNSDVAFFIHTHVREDALALFGFLRAQDKQLFERLLSVSGIGPKLAITILSGMPAESMVAAIKGNNVAALTRIPGIGKKTAERMVLELRDKLDAFGIPAEAAPATSPVEEDVISALVNLGYQRPLAEKALARLGSVAGETFDGAFPQSHGCVGKVRTSAKLVGLPSEIRITLGLSMRRFSPSALFFLCMAIMVLALSLHAADKKQQQSFYIKPDQTADIAAGTKMVIAKQNCENWAMAAGVETLLQRQNVALDQSFWVMRLNGGELCVDPAPTIEALSLVVNKEFVLDDGRHVLLEVHFVPGPPVDVDAVIAGLKLQQLTLLLWRGHPYYLTGITYDERIGRDGTRFFEVKELRLANTYAKMPGVTFEKGRDDPSEIQGILSVVVQSQ